MYKVITFHESMLKYSSGYFLCLILSLYLSTLPEGVTKTCRRLLNKWRVPVCVLWWLCNTVCVVKYIVNDETDCLVSVFSYSVRASDVELLHYVFCKRWFISDLMCALKWVGISFSVLYCCKLYMKILQQFGTTYNFWGWWGGGSSCLL